MSRSWRGTAILQRVYKFREEDRGRLSSESAVDIRGGDLCVCTSHSGDCFFGYTLLRQGGKGWVNGGQFGAYQFGEDCLIDLSDREFHLLLAGEAVSLPSRPVRLWAVGGVLRDRKTGQQCPFSIMSRGVDSTEAIQSVRDYHRNELLRDKFRDDQIELVIASDVTKWVESAMGR